jgi:hypothetical protein
MKEIECLNLDFPDEQDSINTENQAHYKNIRADQWASGKQMSVQVQKLLPLKKFEAIKSCLHKNFIASKPAVTQSSITTPSPQFTPTL